MKSLFPYPGVAAVSAACLALVFVSCGRQNSADAGTTPTKSAHRSTGSPITASRFAQNAATGMDSLLAGKTPSPATRNFFKVYDNVAHTYVRNPECVAAGLDTTCISVANSANADGSGGSRGCVTMITPLHGVTNNHFVQPYENGVVHYFVDRANAVHARTVVDSAQVGGVDIRVVTFNEPLPASIQPAQLLPAGVATRLLAAGTPLLATNQQKQVIVTELLAATSADIIVRPALAPNRRVWTTDPPAVIGDSDSPTFVIVDRRPRLLFTYYTNVSGPSLSENLKGIGALLNKGYTLDVAEIE